MKPDKNKVFFPELFCMLDSQKRRKIEQEKRRQKIYRKADINRNGFTKTIIIKVNIKEIEDQKH